MDAGKWLSEPSGIILRLHLPIEADRRGAYLRWSRSSCDISVLTAAVSYKISGGKMNGLKVAMGGLGPKARRFPELEALFEGRPLLPREDIEKSVMPLLKPIDDVRGSAVFKRLRGAALLADALHRAAIDPPEAAS
jgi:CO/xanthine dehydrogenase FAD-binding subunit